MVKFKKQAISLALILTVIGSTFCCSLSPLQSSVFALGQTSLGQTSLWQPPTAKVAQTALPESF